MCVSCCALPGETDRQLRELIGIFDSPAHRIELCVTFFNRITERLRMGDGMRCATSPVCLRLLVGLQGLQVHVLSFAKFMKIHETLRLGEEAARYQMQACQEGEIRRGSMNDFTGFVLRVLPCAARTPRTPSSTEEGWRPSKICSLFLGESAWQELSPTCSNLTALPARH